MGWLKRETLIERLARETGWAVINRHGDFTQIRADDCSKQYSIHVRYRQDGVNVAFLCYFPVRFPLQMLTQELTMGLLVRNARLIWSKWCIRLAESCEAQAYLYGSLAREGLAAAAFDDLCRDMIAEMDAVHNELQGQAARLGGGWGVAGFGGGHPVNGQGGMPLDQRGVRFLE